MHCVAISFFSLILIVGEPEYRAELFGGGSLSHPTTKHVCSLARPFAHADYERRPKTVNNIVNF